jgi:methylmalonyl-CoA mutase N-terminal domain/subunit
VLAFESDLTSTVDPFAGSFLMESMTDEVEAAATELMAKVAGYGSAVAAIEAGFQKREIEKSAYRIAQEIDAGERVVVGLNRFQVDETTSPELQQIGDDEVARQIERLHTLRASRDDAAVRAGLAAVARAARSTENLLPPMKEALRARATLGEVSDALRDVFGEYRPR